MKNRFLKKLFRPDKPYLEELKETFSLTSEGAEELDASIRAYVAQLDKGIDAISNGIKIRLPDEAKNAATEDIDILCYKI